MTDPVALTGEILGVWGAGGFNDANAMDNCRKYFTADVVFEFENNYKNVSGYKVYNGHQGVLDWCTWLAENIELQGFVPTVFSGPDSDTAMVRLFAEGMTCKATGKTTPPVTDMEQFTFVDGKCSKCQMFFGNASVLDAAFTA